ncbi:MAG: efflux RND transporter periplasmic adaptor subunit [Verrucomicrobia bacterium]|nr:efflux RND transporter periplasmic adaptor subunit [Verrucomicrobiota bacterium]
MNSPRGTIRFLVLAAVLLTAAFLLGFWMRGGHVEPAARHDRADGDEAEAAAWYCSMHPELGHFPDPGRCPICGMALVPVPTEHESKELGPRQVRLSPYARKLSELETTKVVRKPVEAQLRLVGKVEYDETRLGTITAWVPGRLDRLYVDYTGIPVQKGDHLVYLYSPELLTAQEELIQALKTLRALEAGSATPGAVESARLTLDAVREKLRLWGLTPEQVAETEKRGTPSDHMTIYAPMSGIVIHKNAVEGMYVQTGTVIYTIADLSRIWVKLDAYESDLPWIKYAQRVTFEAEAYPGERFEGTVAFIDPILDAKTRTVKVRVNVENPEGRLKPGMFVRAIVRAQVAAGGRVVSAALAGKWISPMHPEIVKDESGTCDVCGMPLVRAESLGYVSPEDVQAEAPLVIPASAPILTGRRAVVYVEVPGEPGVYEGREIALGPRAGDYYIVNAGLAEGESVVSSGGFKIDSALQILAKPSMMSPEGGTAPPDHDHGAATPITPNGDTEAATGQEIGVPAVFTTQLDAVLGAYFEVQHALSRDELDGATAGATALLSALDEVDMALLQGPAHEAWMKELQGLTKSAKALATAREIAKAREAFEALSAGAYVVAKHFGTGGAQPILRFHCPMAFDGRGADWLQRTTDTENPYFGSQMFRCGEQVETVAAGAATQRDEHGHE